MKRRTPTACLCSSSINLQHMPPCHQSLECDGGKQRIEHDTVIPDSNPVAEHRGKPQKMTLEDGTPKDRKSDGSMSRICVQSAHQFVHGRTQTVVWRAFSASRMTLRSSSPCLNCLSRRQATSVSSSPSSIVN